MGSATKRVRTSTGLKEEPDWSTRLKGLSARLGGALPDLYGQASRVQPDRRTLRIVPLAGHLRSPVGGGSESDTGGDRRDGRSAPAGRRDDNPSARLARSRVTECEHDASPKTAHQPAPRAQKPVNPPKNASTKCDAERAVRRTRVQAPPPPLRRITTRPLRR
jgi:hypothetical protein